MGRVTPSSRDVGEQPRSRRDDTLDARKRALRERVLGARDALSPQYRSEASRAIASALTTQTAFAAAETALVTLPFGSEWDTRALLVAARAKRMIVAVPRVNRSTRMLEIYCVEDEERDLEVGYRGIPEPRAGCAPVPFDAIDWVLVPGVAFDTRGHRIGYGGGYFDRLLPLLRPDAARVAGAFDVQIVDDIPVAPHDQSLHAIVTETRTLHIG